MLRLLSSSRPLAVAFLAASVCLLQAAAIQAQEKRCHVLIFADTDDENIGVSCDVDAGKLFTLFYSNIPENRLSIESFRGNDQVTRQNILNQIRQVQLRRDDTLIVYYSGHGAFDPERGHYLQTPGGQYTFRSEVIQAMQQRNVRLGILITDTCSVVQRVRQPQQTFAMVLGPETTKPLFAALCWDSAGFVDVSGSTRGEFAMGANDIGGYFTSELCRFLNENANRRMEWPAVFQGVRPLVDQLFRTRHREGIRGPDGNLQYTQTVDGRFTPAQGTGGGGGQAGGGQAGGQGGGGGMQGGPRFGARAVNDPRGVRITQVVPNSPATRCSVVGQPGLIGSLDVGDIIVEINGRAIRNENDYARAVDTSPRQMRLTIINSKNGSLLELEVQLAR